LAYITDNFLKNNMILSETVCIINQTSSDQDKVNLLAEKLGLLVNPENMAGYKFYLSFQQETLKLSRILPGKAITLDNKNSIFVDFSCQQLKRAEITNCLIAKAMGSTERFSNLHVLDTSTGLGVDGFTFLLLGCRVTLLERSPIIFELLSNGLERISSAPIRERVQLFHIEAVNYLHNLKVADNPDIIYLDPMYSDRNKAALAKKEMQILKELIGDDKDAADVLKEALHHARKKVIVKRRRLDSNLGNIAPNFKVVGKAVRFDVYLPICQ
jgi:16S rRNA (guanine1516-N2)-methyltransferase